MRYRRRLSVDRAVADLLERGLEDWVQLDELLWVTTHGARDPRAKALTRQVLDRIYTEGLMVPGELGSGFEDWPSPSTWLERSLEQVDSDERLPLEGHWLRLTDRGTAQAESVSWGTGPGESVRRPFSREEILQDGLEVDVPLADLTGGGDPSPELVALLLDLLSQRQIMVLEEDWDGDDPNFVDAARAEELLKDPRSYRWNPLEPGREVSFWRVYYGTTSSYPELPPLTGYEWPSS